MSSLGRPNLPYNAKFFIDQLSNLTNSNILDLKIQNNSNVKDINSNIEDINTINERIGNDQILQQLDPFIGYEIVEFQQSTGLINRIDEILYDVESLKIVIGEENVEPKTGFLIGFI